MSSTSTCQCGCCGLTTNPGCTYSATGRTSDEKICSGDGVVDIATMSQVWNLRDCPRIYSNILFTAPGDVLSYNSANLPRIQSDIDYLMSKYQSFGLNFTDSVVSPQYNSFQYELLGLCSDYTVPGGCDLFLSRYCPQYTRDEIGADSVLASLCGCYVDPIYPTTTVSPQCDSMCHLTTTAQIADPCTGVINRCSNTVCVIDDVNISLVDTEANAAFQQICPACDQVGSDPCVCIISGTDVSSTIDSAGVGTNYTQYCGTNAICYQTNEAGALVQVQCPPADSGTSAPTYQIPLGLFIIALVIVAIVVIAMLATRSSKKANAAKMEKEGIMNPAAVSVSESKSKNQIKNEGKGKSH